MQESDSETAFGYGIGLGAEFWGSGRIGAQLEILYISGLTDPNADFFEIRASLDSILGE